MFTKGANSHIWKRTEGLLSENNLNLMMRDMGINDKVEYSNEDLKKAKYGDMGQASRLINAKHKK